MVPRNLAPGPLKLEDIGSGSFLLLDFSTGQNDYDYDRYRYLFPFKLLSDHFLYLLFSSSGGSGGSEPNPDTSRHPRQVRPFIPVISHDFLVAILQRWWVRAFFRADN